MNPLTLNKQKTREISQFTLARRHTPLNHRCESEAQSLSKLERCDLLLLLTVMHVTWKGTTWMDGEKKTQKARFPGCLGRVFLSFVFFPGANAGCKNG